ncbi:chemotaxis protein CheW [Delftia sp. DT-2]|uniref:chemotaxis protein CheW n=2 Tax=unclassified Delftia TaxID=2613839 RepID=UPI00233F2850|nr:chemotaxis protein CheW [Delftia sp. DT-2]MDC2858860.1 chemotaxis protein CheW [Delftia sp. DT-2]
MATSLPTDLILPHLRELNRNAADLREIRLMWRLIEASARMQASQQGQALVSMLTDTRQGLEQLEQGLLQSQLAQSAQEAMAQLGMQSSHAIDLLVRSLYERTADVGFLAADSVLCEAMAQLGDGDILLDMAAGGLHAWQAPLQLHLQAYRAKYTVYDDILLLDTQGQVCARAQAGDKPLPPCAEGWFQQCLQQAGHVSHFGASCVLPGADRLIYAQRLLHPRTMAVLGVLCLSFDFAAEMQAIFASGGPRAQVGLLLDAAGVVIASSDDHWIAPGSRVPMHHGDAVQPLIHAGRTYLVRTARALPYQGYAGPEGWQTQVMAPLDLAFATQQRPQVLQALEPAIAEGLMAQSRGFCPPLHAMARAADDIRRVVWNGQVLAASQAPESPVQGTAHPDPLQAVLEQMSETGDLTHAVFTRAIHGLHETALSTRLQEHTTLNRLLMDLLERNLYERANDCRWWALTPGLQKVLQDNSGCLALSVQAHDAAQRLLEQLNALYTVYARIALYDAQGLVLACSHEDEPGLPLSPGVRVQASALQATMALRDAQAYHVQELDDGGLPVHVYHAALRAPSTTNGHGHGQGADQGPAIGGIALLFHTRRELQAMLQAAAQEQSEDAGPEDHGLPRLPMEAFYVARDGRIIAASHGGRPLGSCIEGVAGLATLADGEVRSSIEEIEGHYCIVGMAAGRGYREFRLDQGAARDAKESATEDTLAGLVSLSLQRLGPVHADARNRALRLAPATRLDGSRPVARALAAHGGGDAPVELASFYVGASLLALRAADVCEALPASAISPVAAGRLPFCVGALARRSQGSVSGYVWVFDLAALLQGRPGVVTEQSQVIVVQHGGLRVGLLVSALQGVHRLPASALVESPMLSVASTTPALVRELVHAGAGLPLIQCLDPAALMQRLQPSRGAAANADRSAAAVEREAAWDAQAA